MGHLTKFIYWITGACAMFGSKNRSEDIEGSASTPVDLDDEEDDDHVDETDKAISGSSTTYVSLLFGGPASVLFVFNPEAQGHQQRDGGSSSLAWLFHDGSLAANFLAMSLACVLLFYTLANPAPSRRATRFKKSIARISLFWFVLGVFSRIYLALPQSYRNPVMVLTGVGLILSVIFLLCSVLWSSRIPSPKKLKSSRVGGSPLPLFLLKSSQVSTVDVHKTVYYASNAKANPHEGYGGKRTTEGINRTQGGMPVKGGGGAPSPFEDTGDPPTQSNQGNQQPSSRNRKQTIERAKTVKPREAPMERAKGIQEELNQRITVINLLDEAPGIERYSDEWLFAASLLQDCSNRDFFVALDDPSRRGNWIKRKYKANQRSRAITVGNREAGGELPSMMRMWSPGWKIGQQREMELPI